MGAMAPVILRKRLIAPAVSNCNGKFLLTLGTHNIKIINTLLLKALLSVRKQLTEQLPEGHFDPKKYDNFGTIERIKL